MQSIFTIPAPKSNLSFIKVGDYNQYHPSSDDFEIIRNLVLAEQLTTEEVSKLLMVTGVKDFAYEKSQNDYVFVFFCEHKLALSTQEDWFRLLVAADEYYKENPDSYYAILHSPVIYDIKKIKKSLLPFL